MQAQEARAAGAGFGPGADYCFKCVFEMVDFFV